jgi:hypothetical protein
MGFLAGVISDRLRAKFKPTDKVWTPQRAPESKPMPKDGSVQGIRLSSGRRSYVKKK